MTKGPNSKNAECSRKTSKSPLNFLSNFENQQLLVDDILFYGAQKWDKFATFLEEKNRNSRVDMKRY